MYIIYGGEDAGPGIAAGGTRSTRWLVASLLAYHPAGDRGYSGRLHPVVEGGGEPCGYGMAQGMDAGGVGSVVRLQVVVEPCPSRGQWLRSRGSSAWC